jgi:hypothetical protein
MNRRNFLLLTGAGIAATAVASATPGTVTAALRPKTAPTLDITFATGRKNSNGHIYTRDAWESAVERAKEGKLFLTLPNNSGELRLDQVCGIVQSVEIVPDPEYGYRATARVKALSTPAGALLKKMCEARTNLYMASSGIGGLNDNETVHSYSISHFFITDDPAFVAATPIRLVE